MGKLKHSEKAINALVPVVGCGLGIYLIIEGTPLLSSGNVTGWFNPGLGMVAVGVPLTLVMAVIVKDILRPPNGKSMVNYGGQPRRRKSSPKLKNTSFGLSIPGLFDKPQKSLKNTASRDVYLDDLDLVFTREEIINRKRVVRRFDGWILWKFLQISEFKQEKLDLKKSRAIKSGEPLGKVNGALSRNTWVGVVWVKGGSGKDGDRFRKSWYWSKLKWGLVFGTLKAGCLMFEQETGIRLMSGLGGGETPRLLKPYGTVYHCVATVLLERHDWLLNIYKHVSLVGTGSNRAGLDGLVKNRYYER